MSDTGLSANGACESSPTALERREGGHLDGRPRPSRSLLPLLVSMSHCRQQAREPHTWAGSALLEAQPGLLKSRESLGIGPLFGC